MGAVFPAVGRSRGSEKAMLQAWVGRVSRGLRSRRAVEGSVVVFVTVRRNGPGMRQQALTAVARVSRSGARGMPGRDRARRGPCDAH